MVATVNWLLGKGGDTSHPSLEINGKQVTESKNKASAFNNFFLSHSNIIFLLQNYLLIKIFLKI